MELDPPDLNVLQDEALIENERRLAVARAITSLPQKYRAAIVLRDVEGLSYDQIAQSLKLSEGTVKSRINRARNLLKEKLSAYM
jgi:RNA polymerase sigma-70 factor (ECF subfamily)